MTAFHWQGRLDPERGLSFDLHLETAGYGKDGKALLTHCLAHDRPVRALKRPTGTVLRLG